jgi:hypothetical protein
MKEWTCILLKSWSFSIGLSLGSQKLSLGLRFAYKWFIWGMIPGSPVKKWEVRQGREKNSYRIWLWASCCWMDLGLNSIVRPARDCITVPPKERKQSVHLWANVPYVLMVFSGADSPKYSACFLLQAEQSLLARKCPQMGTQGAIILNRAV